MILNLKKKNGKNILTKWKEYRKLPVIIKARKAKEGERIVTLEGVMTANKGDMIICGVKGELYPCKLDIFKATYEEV
jgi:hypothetical protein